MTHYSRDYTVNETVPSPAPGILKYPDFHNPYTKYRYWSCDDYLIDVLGMSNFREIAIPVTQDAITGICRAAKGYIWGFSFLLTFVVSILHLVCVLLMYALWMDVCRHRRARAGRRRKFENNGQFKDAVQMVMSAQRHYGAGIAEWDATSLDMEILKGKIGMGHGGGNEPGVVRRDVSRRSKELGDPNGGDWGGDVELNDRR